MLTHTSSEVAQLSWGMGDAWMKRFLKRYCLKPDGSAGSSSLWGVSTRTHGVVPSSNQHFYKRNQEFRSRRTDEDGELPLKIQAPDSRATPSGDKRVLHDAADFRGKKLKIFSSSQKKDKKPQEGLATNIKGRNSRFIKVGTKR